MKNSIIAILFVLLLMLASSALGQVSGEWTYIVSDGCATITKYTGTETAVSIPQTIDDYPVTIIGENAFSLHKTLISVTIPEGITSIDYFAFAFCTSLETIYLPNSIVSINERAFYQCFTDILFYASINSEGAKAVSRLSYSYIDPAYPYLTLRYQYDNDQITGLAVINAAEDITEAILPEPITTINNAAFKNCSALKFVSIPDSMISISSSAFFGCSNLSSITISSSVTTIGKEAFRYCTSLTSIIIPDSINSIADKAFSDCPAIKYCTANSNGSRALSKAGYSFIDSRYPGIYLRYSFSSEDVTGFAVVDADERIVNTAFPDGITVIGDYAFQNCSDFTSIIIPDSVTSIGAYAFAGCSSLVSVSVPDSVTSIGSASFYNCSSLTTINIPDSVNSVRNDTFASCPAIRYCTIGANGSKALSKAGYSFVDVHYPNISLRYTYTDEDITGFAVVNAVDDILNVTFPDGITAIGASAFNGCSKLTTISVPDSVTTIDAYAFYNCSALISLSIPDSVTTIGANAFDNCTALTSVSIPDSVSSICSHAFANCTNLAAVSLPEGVSSIESYAFYKCSSLSSVSIPGSVNAIKDSAFRDCTSLQSVIISDGVSSIDSDAFRDCSGLTSIIIPDSVISIGQQAFQNCTSLTDVTLPDGITSMGYYSFGYNSLGRKTTFYCSLGSDTAKELSKYSYQFIDASNPSLYLCYRYNNGSISGLAVVDAKEDIENACIPDEVTSIDNSAFRDCTRLISVFLPDSITNIGSWAFNNCSSLTSITIPSGVSSIGDNTFASCSSLVSISLPESIFSIGAWAFHNCTSLVSVSLPESVSSIGARAFYNCSTLSSISIPSGVLTIDDYTFSDCISLVSVSLPDSITSIGAHAFYDCPSLISILIPSGVSSINDYTFYGCSSLISVSLPDSVTSIGDSAFSNCKSLNTIDLPDNLSTIGNYAFGGSSLKAVTLPESVQSIGATAFSIYNKEEPFLIYIPDNVKEIGNASLSRNAVIYCHEYSYAESWAHTGDNNYTVVLLSGDPFDKIGRIDIDDVSLIASGRQLDLHINVFPSYSGLNISYASSAPNTLSVDEKGRVAGLKNGTADLIVTAGNLTVRKTLQVVTPAADFQIEDIYVPAKGTQSIGVSGITPTNATLTLRWETADPVIANIDENGLLNGYVIGSTSYSATDTLTGLKRSATVYIIGPISNIEFDQAVLNLYPLQSAQLVVTATSGSYTFHNQAMTYSSSDEAIATVDEKGFVTAHQSGTVLITAKSVIGNASATCQVHVIQATTMNIPNGTTVIRDNAFKGTAAEVYVIPDSVTSIGAHAFADLPNAKLIVLPKEVDVDPTAFEGTTAEISQ